MLFLFTKFCLQNRALFCDLMYSCSKFTFARWSEVKTRFDESPLPVKLRPFVATGRNLVNTSWRLPFLLPFYAIAEERNKFYIERMLRRLSITDSHLNSRDRRRRWESLGGSGRRLSSFPYSVISSLGSDVRAPIYLRIERHSLNV